MGVTGILPSIVLLTLAQKVVNPPSEQSEDGERGDVEQEVQHVRLPHFLTRFTGFGDLPQRLPHGQRPLNFISQSIPNAIPPMTAIKAI
jgi:hypothetical protein